MYANKGPLYQMDTVPLKQWRIPFMMFLSALISIIGLYIIRILLVGSNENSAFGYAQS